MDKKKASRPAATGNGSRSSKLRIILSDSRLRNKIYLSVMRGAFAGGVLAMLYGILKMDGSILEGLVITVVGFIWSLAFYLINPDDITFGG